jgi:NADH-quinone oxidoreductase subunit G
MTETTETVTLTIDGKEVSVPKGTLLIRVAEQLGVIIPRFCDHPLLDPVGACRQCVVEVEGQMKPFMACTTTAMDGMVVKTHLTSDVAAKAQTGTLEFLLINHPLDCPMCDKGGECPLQDQAMAHGSHTSRFIDQKRRYDKPVAVSPQILLDRERCVLCARCTRFADQIAGDPFIELFERGALEQVAIYEDEPYASYFSGNVIQICPVGALTSADYRFKARPFDLRSASSVCDHCSAGCNLTVQSRRGRIERQLARTNMRVNEMWNCDRGRFGFTHLTADTRITAPLVRSGGDLVEADWADALVAATRAMRDDEGNLKRVAVVAGGRLADEDAYAASKLARTVLRTDDVDFRTRFADPAEVDALTALQGRDTATYADVEAAPVIVTVGLDPDEEVPILFLRIRKAWRNRGAKIVPVGPRAGTLAQHAWRRLVTDVDGETGALAALGRAVGLAGLAEPAAASGYHAPHLQDVVEALKAAPGAVILVGERAPAGALAAAGQLAETVGGKVAWVPRRSNARGALDAGLAAGALPGGRRLADDEDRAAVATAWGTDLPASRGRDLQQILEAAAAGQIDVLYLLGVDLARDAASPALAAKALTKATVVVQDLGHTETTTYADVILPVTASQERSGSRTDWEGRSQRFTHAVDGPRLVQDDWEILIQIAGLLGGDLGFNDLDGIRADRDRLGRRATPHAWPAVAAIESGDGEAAGLALVTSPQLIDRGVTIADAVHLQATARVPHVELHPDDAAARGITDGDEVAITGAVALRLPARLTADQAPGTVHVPANSTDEPAAALGDRAQAPIRVEVALAETAEVPA